MPFGSILSCVLVVSPFNLSCLWKASPFSLTSSNIFNNLFACSELKLLKYVDTSEKVITWSFPSNLAINTARRPLPKPGAE